MVILAKNLLTYFNSVNNVKQIIMVSAQKIYKHYYIE